MTHFMRNILRSLQLKRRVDITRQFIQALLFGPALNDVPLPASTPALKISTTLSSAQNARVLPTARHAEIPAEEMPLLVDEAAFAEPANEVPDKVVDLTEPDQRPPEVCLQASGGTGSSFTEHVFEFGEESYPYRLFIPSGADEPGLSPLPLLVMLHGCKQNAADFARGTAMNELAEQAKCLVLYPEQLLKANSLRCWNWFEKAQHARDNGEAGMIAALTQSVLKERGADPDRVYIAGLSAGGAMSALMAGLYPELFAAVGVHSGLPVGVARVVISALIAMRRGPGLTARANSKSGVMPTIVFHGNADETVHPANGDHIVETTLAAWGDFGVVMEKTLHTTVVEDGNEGRREVVRATYSAPDGRPLLEHWAIEAGPHAWSGGDEAGSYTDPQGPNASAAMLAFFLLHQRHPQVQ